MMQSEYLLRERNNSALEALETYLRDMAIELGADPTVAQQDAAAVVDLQRELAIVSRPVSVPAFPAILPSHGR